MSPMIFMGIKISSISEEITGIEEYIGRVKEKEKLFVENQLLEAKKYARDSSLFASGVFSRKRTGEITADPQQDKH